MSKTFYYRSHIKKMDALFKIIAVVLAVLGIVFIFIFEGEDQLYGPLTMFGLAIYIYVITFLFKSMITTEITIDDHGIRFKNNKKDFQILYEDIKSINTRSVSNLGGYFVIEKNTKEKIRITIVLRSIHEFVKLLKENLDQRELMIYDEEKLYKFYTMAYYSDTSWDRLYKTFIHITIALFSVVGMYFYAARFTKTMSDFKMAETIFKSYPIFFIGIILYFEFGVFAKDIRKNTNRETWEVPDVDIKSTATTLSVPVVLLAGLYCLALLYTVLK